MALEHFGVDGPDDDIDLRQKAIQFIEGFRHGHLDVPALRLNLLDLGGCERARRSCVGRGYCGNPDPLRRRVEDRDSVGSEQCWGGRRCCRGR
jgi:hypothetical protein